MGDTLLFLKRATHAQEGCGFHEGDVLLKDFFPQYQIDKTGFIFEGHEDNACSRTWALAADNEACVANGLAVFSGTNSFGTIKALAC